jgi:dTDP-4-amino-4,6-dideoxygalactose transaminase
MWAGQGVGSIGDVGSFSFQQSKTMSSAEGGICITNDAQVAEKIFRMKHIGYGPGQLQGMAKDGPPRGLLCYPFRATAFQAVVLQEQLDTLPSLLERYAKAASYLEARLGKATKIRFQRRGRRTERQGYFGWVMLFDDPCYSGIPISVIQRALVAEGVPALVTWDPVYHFILFNLPPNEYRVEGDCAAAESTSARMLWLLHAFLGIDAREIERIADAIEKVEENLDELRRLAKRA